MTKSSRKHSRIFFGSTRARNLNTDDRVECVRPVRPAKPWARELGLAEGEAKGEARALLTVLRGRGIAVPDAARERILAQKDPERLERWLEKASVAASLEEVLDEPS